MTNSYAILIAVLLFPGGLFALALGLALKGADRRVAARLQGRVGPPLAQPFFDIVKLGFKRTMVPDQACETVFLAAPLVGTVSMLLAVVMIPISGIYNTPDPQFGNLLVLLYLLAIPGVALMVAGSASGSPYGAIGFSREMAMMIAYEGPIVLVVTAVALRTGLAEGHWPTFSLAEIVRYQQVHGAFILDPVMWPAVAAFAFFYPANLGIVPFDIPEAETEVLEGPLLEYSGPALALFKVMSALKAVVVLSLGVALFMPLPLTGIAGLAGWAAQLLVLVLVGVTAVRVGRGRMRIDQAFVFFLKWPLLLAIVSLVIAAYYTTGVVL
jgi:formate hydrogenlyase subunit 4